MRSEVARGSSPRVWGQVLIILMMSIYLRIIPTRVGTSTKEGKQVEYNKDHPHACGDKCSHLAYVVV